VNDKRLSLSRTASSPRGRSLVLPPRPGWRDLAGRCWHARPLAASTPPTNPAPEPAITRAMFRVAVSGRREWEASFLTVVVWRDQAEHAAQSLAKGSRVVVMGRLQQRSWTAEDGSARSRRGGRGRGAGAEPAVGDGDDDQNHEESGPVASSTDGTVRDVGEACRVFRSVVSVLLRALGDVSPHPQGRPCGWPPAAAVLGRQIIGLLNQTSRPPVEAGRKSGNSRSRGPAWASSHVSGPSLRP
jgi:Single-strand binding protein family